MMSRRCGLQFVTGESTAAGRAVPPRAAGLRVAGVPLPIITHPSRLTLGVTSRDRRGKGAPSHRRAGHAPRPIQWTPPSTRHHHRLRDRRNPGHVVKERGARRQPPPVMHRCHIPLPTAWRQTLATGGQGGQKEPRSRSEVGVVPLVSSSGLCTVAGGVPDLGCTAAQVGLLDPAQEHADSKMWQGTAPPVEPCPSAKRHPHKRRFAVGHPHARPQICREDELVLTSI